jgi:hypothetical protein
MRASELINHLQKYMQKGFGDWEVRFWDKSRPIDWETNRPIGFSEVKPISEERDGTGDNIYLLL